MVRLVSKTAAKKDEKPTVSEQVLVQDVKDEEAGKASGGACFPVPWPPYKICW